MPDPVTRIAAPGDLATAAVIHAAGEAEMAGRLHPLAGLGAVDEASRAASALAALQRLHDADPRQVWVAEQDGQVIGVASAAFRGRHAHIQSLFVARGARERRTGGALLASLTEAGKDAGCSVFTLQASDDPRALTRYLRLGLRPRPPSIVWSATDPLFPTPGLGNPLEAIPLDPDDSASLNTVADIDKAVRGVSRLPDVLRWLRNGEQGALLVDRSSGTPAGYFLLFASGDRGHIGPVAAIDLSRFGDVLGNALYAASRAHRAGRIWRLATPGENDAAIAPLLAARFRPAYTVPFFATALIGRFDRYTFHDLDLL